MRGKSRLPQQDVSAEEAGMINLTPLIDVVFVVLIMFIVVAPMLDIDRVALAPSAAHENKQHPSLQQENALMLYVHPDNSIWLHSKLVRSEELFKILQNARRQNPRLSIKLFHDKKAHFGTYQTIKNCAEAAGFEELDVILQPGG
ncbi:MAG TPA: biopolymer transporter ExbD [Rhabdochlamydiaceae bacterium]|nr:biopolymer transporter ExbD [Rhabdochlamydiaceae bacterium]